MGGGSMNAASLINFFILKKIIKIKKNELIKLTKINRFRCYFRN